MQPSGAKWWRYRYRFNGTAKMLSMRVYPEAKLKEARRL
ncbi:Arm DNA-binding domain-containing protein [Nitrosomonas supralitoralis]